MPSSWKNKICRNGNLIDHTAGIFHIRISLESVCLTLSMGTVLDHTGSVGQFTRVRFSSCQRCSQTKNSLLRQQAAIANSQGLLPESLIWNYVIQLTSALRFLQLTAKLCAFNLLLTQIRARGWACLQNTRPIKDLGFGQKPSPGQLRGHF